MHPLVYYTGALPQRAQSLAFERDDDVLNIDYEDSFTNPKRTPRSTFRRP